ncbi:MAG: hypothetical protein JW993_10780 [Sedimentisphaerales bacterium]|nr:hypothetical protein [Sedimentisphaerales bacterium]
MFGYRRRRRRDRTARLTTKSLSLARLTPGTALIFVLTAMIGGCGTVSTGKVYPVPHRTAVEFPFRASLDGLVIAVEPYTDSERVERHFGLNLLAHGFIPFEVLFVNEAGKGGFFLQPESAVLTDESGLDALKFASADTGVFHPDPSVPRAVGGFFQMFSPLSVLISSLALTMEEGYRRFRDVSRRMESLGYSDRPLYPTDSKRGFLYLGLADVGELDKADAIVFRVRNVQSRQEKIMVVSLKAK